MPARLHRLRRGQRRFLGYGIHEFANALYVEGKAALRAVCFSPSGFAVAGDEGVIRIGVNAIANWQVLTSHPVAIHALAASANGEYLYSAGDDGVIRVWLLPQGIVLHEFRGHVGDSPDPAGERWSNPPQRRRR